MNKKTIINTILIILVLAGITAIAYWYWQNQKQVVVDDQLNIDAVTDNSGLGDLALPDLNDPNTSDDDVATSPPPTSDIKLNSNLYYFVERFGTYSNVANFENIEDLKPVMTSDFYNQVISNRKNITFAEQGSMEYDAYDAQITKVEWTDENDESATALVTTRRHHITADSNDSFNQDIIVRLEKINEQWLITEAIWQ